ncbi:hypothetical protein RS022_01050 [Candidatus Phytoplasma rubi]|uniref:Uncharacterized protein n=1 Tax=Candidatus Phytoplasma rubi TaxID=399025 RepID=A0ABY7BRN6_9MOLU|nr:hypothetical protein RS022_01050 [Candidatus Phytoplasma rubi]
MIFNIFKHVTILFIVFICIVNSFSIKSIHSFFNNIASSFVVFIYVMNSFTIKLIKNVFNRCTSIFIVFLNNFISVIVNKFFLVVFIVFSF